MSEAWIEGLKRVGWMGTPAPVVWLVETCKSPYDLKLQYVNEETTGMGQH